jgi:ABC-type thiamine transport system substrate-binding protein
VQIDDMIRHVSTMRKRAKTSEVGLAFMRWILASWTEDASGKIRK